MTRKLELLDQYQHKAACVHTQRRAEQIWRELEPLLDSKEKGYLSIAVSHHQLGEGREEFDDVCKRIRNGELTGEFP